MFKIYIFSIFVILFSASHAIRRQIPYEVYVKSGGLPLPDALRTKNDKWYLYENNSNDTFIIGGTQAAEGDAPWIVSLGAKRHFCAGSIINSRTIITAAHCTRGSSPDSIQIRYNSLQHASGGSIVNVSKILVHPRYSSSTIDNDISILHLSAPLSLDGIKAKAVSLPISGSDPSAGTELMVAGWGTTSQGGSYLPPDLLKVFVSVFSRSKCRDSYGRSSITNNMFCAGVPEGGKDSCQGDSGGPLTNSNGQLVGVVSWGRGCAQKSYPGVYTRVANYNDWIEKNSA